MSAILYNGYWIPPGSVTAPCRYEGASKYSGKEPKTQRVPSENIRIKANVASTWSKWFLLYNFRIIVISTIAPAKAAAEKAANIDAKHISIVISPSDTFCQKNMGKSILDLKNQISDIMEIAKDNNMKVRGYISTVADCPYEGIISYKKVAELIVKK